MRGLLHRLAKWKRNDEYVKWLVEHTKGFLPKITFITAVRSANIIITAFLAILGKRIIDAAGKGGNFRDDFIYYLLVLLVSTGLSALSTMYGVIIDEHFSFGIRKQLYERIIHSRWINVTKYHTGDMMTRLTSDASNISNCIVRIFPNIFVMVLQVLVSFGILFYYNHVIAFVSLLFAPVTIAITYTVGKKLKRLEIKVQESEAAYRSYLQESLSNLLVVKAFNAESPSVSKLIELRDNRFKWIRLRARMNVINSTVLSLSFQTGYIVAFSYSAVMIARGEISYGTMTVFLTLINRVQGPILDLARMVPSIVKFFASTERMVEMQNIPYEENGSTVIESDDIGVGISNVTYGYTSSETLFAGANMTINPGEFLAIIGESGIGKTTLIRLIMSYMDVGEGEITFFDGLGNSDIACRKTRDYLAYVPQGNTLFSGSVVDNIRMGNPEATDAEVDEAVKLAAADFIYDLPDGLNTPISEKGLGLSEGQAQRIAIARALVKKAPVLILDEATSALDEKTELRVLEGLRRLNPKPTCLIITHRYSILQYCNREIKIDNRRIIEMDLNHEKDGIDEDCVAY